MATSGDGVERNDANSARRYLTRTVSLHGDFETRARAELNKLR